MRLKNVLEVYDTGKKQEESGARFLGFRDVSLVPFDMKLIDRGQLSLQDVNLIDEIISNINLLQRLIYNFRASFLFIVYLFQQIKWLNDYNARIRIMVGEELKKQYSMQSFYWMMNNTMHVKEYFTESEYRARTSQSNFIHFGQWMCIVTLIVTLLLAQ